MSNDIVEQTPKGICDFSSQYGSNTAQSYSVVNICTDAQIYPSYGDSTNALVFRTYGPWWINLPSYKNNKRNFQRIENNFTSRDFVDIRYENLVYQCISLNLYETYNPGSLEVVYAGEENENGDITWHRVWKFPEPFSIVLENHEEIFINNGRQQIQDLFPDRVDATISAFHSLNLNTDNKLISKIHTNHTYPPAARLPRIVKIPLENKIPFPTRHIRVEFDHCTANYYIEIDTIKLCGSIVKSNVPLPIKNQPEKQHVEKVEENPQMHLTKLPFDLLYLICSYLDLRSLIHLSSTCRLLREQCLHPLQFKSLNLQPYWSDITNNSIENFFSNYCSQTRYLSLAWTKSIQYSSFNQFLTNCSTNLVQLDLACCQYLTGEHIAAIADLCPNIEILNFENCFHLKNSEFLPLKNLSHIRSLNVYRTHIDYRTLLPLIDNNKQHLENINLGSCQSLVDTIGIIRLLFARCPNLRSIDLWRLRNLTANGYASIVGLPYNTSEENLRYANLSAENQEDLTIIYSAIDMPIEIHSVTHMTCLTEIDIGWTDPPAGFVANLVAQAGRCLIKIFLTACRRTSDRDILAISQHCPKLRQLDILGSSAVTEPAIEEILKRCLDMEFIDLSFCSKISGPTIADWITKYKRCFKQSYQPMNTGDPYVEYP